MLLLCTIVGTSVAQRTISGKVTDDKNDPLIGANVQVKGTITGTTTDVDGMYSLEVAPDATILVVSYTGYTVTEVSIGNQSRVDVVMKEGVALQEIVVTGQVFAKTPELAIRIPRFQKKM
jgi:hypothetical protein